MPQDQQNQVPSPVVLPLTGPPVLGCGSESKNSFCLTKGNLAYVSAQTGNLTDPKDYRHYTHSVDHLCNMLDVQPQLIAHDSHPDYASTRFAIKFVSAQQQLSPVQHHHAHMAACMAENDLTGPVIGITYDGMGLGTDGTMWGGEILLGDYSSFKRPFHFKPYPLPGGDRATLYPERAAYSALLHEYHGAEEPFSHLLPGLQDQPTRNLLRTTIQQRVRSPLSSSAGRLFDIAAAILGFTGSVQSPGQAAIWLQKLATQTVDEAFPYSLHDHQIDFGPMLKAIVDATTQGTDASLISAMFHNTLADATVAASTIIRDSECINTVTLSGGVFHNELLSDLITHRLRQKSFDVFHHNVLPPGDQSISLGQVAITLARCHNTAS